MPLIGKAMLRVLSFWLLLAVVPPLQAQPAGRKFNLVTKEATALVIAQAVAIDLYGEEEISGQLPLKAVRLRDHWRVMGVLPPGIPGGVVEVHISIRDATVLKIFHTQ